MLLPDSNLVGIPVLGVLPQGFLGIMITGAWLDS